jgi:hypothetical protein
MTVAISTDAAQTGWLKIKVVGDANATGLLGQVYNPEGVLLQIVRGFLYIKATATNAAVILVGIGATGVSDNTVLATLAWNQTAGTVWQVVGQDLASEGAATTPKGVLWPATSYLTFTNSVAAATTTLEAYLFLQYIRLA